MRKSAHRWLVFVALLVFTEFSSCAIRSARTVAWAAVDSEPAAAHAAARANGPLPPSARVVDAARRIDARAYAEGGNVAQVVSEQLSPSAAVGGDSQSGEAGAPTNVARSLEVRAGRGRAIQSEALVKAAYTTPRPDTGSTADAPLPQQLSSTSRKWQDHLQSLQFVSKAPVNRRYARVSRDVSASDRKEYYRAVEFERHGDYLQAWPIVASLARKYRKESAIMHLGCRLSAQIHGARNPTGRLCATAARVDSKSSEPFVTLARLYVQQSPNRALELLRRAQSRLETNRRARDRAQRWQELADEYSRLGVITPLEETLRHLPNGPKKREYRDLVLTTRRRYGLPHDGKRFGITIEREKAYTELVSTVLARAAASEFHDAEAAARKGLRLYRNAPGLLIALCDIYARQGEISRARSHCQQGLARYSQSVWGHYLFASLAQQKGHHQSAIKHLERAIALDPSLESAYRALASEYEIISERKKRLRLQNRYQAQFAQPLQVPAPAQE